MIRKVRTGLMRMVHTVVHTTQFTIQYTGSGEEYAVVDSEFHVAIPEWMYAWVTNEKHSCPFGGSFMSFWRELHGHQGLPSNSVLRPRSPYDNDRPP